ncbi:amidohydrolase [Halolactibacillus alkaliphilus]|nr:amidohydrolase [Halolactibacillus alkaliphilus]
MLMLNGTFYTMADVEDTVEAVVVEADHILYAGNKKVAESYIEESDDILDLQGATVFPGFIDNHVHMLWLGEKLDRLDLSTIHSRQAVLKAIEEKVNTLQPDEWLIAEGFNDNQWDDTRIIDRLELDAISTKHPIVLTRVCRHALVANQLAMTLAGVTRETPTPIGGYIGKDDSGRLTGYFKDTAQELIKRSEPEKDVPYLKRMIALSVEHLVSKGLVGGHTEDLSYFGSESYEKVTAAFRAHIQEGRTPFKTHALVHHDVLTNYLLDPSKSEALPYYTFGAMKIFVDGAFGGRTAWLNAPYSDNATTSGLYIHEEAELEALIKTARKHHLAIAAHTIGDRAIETLVKLLKQYPSTSSLPDRVIHASLVSDKAIALMQDVPIILDVQPLFVSSDFPWVIDRLGEKRAQQLYRFNTLTQSGIPILGSSDGPIEDVSPLKGIAVFVNRRSIYDGKSYTKEEALTVYQAIESYTKKSAIATNTEATRGQIKTGYAADFTILAANPFHVNTEDLSAIAVKMTMIDGQIVYKNNAL